MSLFKGRLTTTLTLILLLASLIPFNLIPTADAFIILPGVTYNCDNEYYAVSSSVPAGLSFDNLTLATHWISFNGLGFNVSYAGTKIYDNLTSIASYPKSSTGWIINWTQQRWSSTFSYYTIGGLKISYDYILYSNGTGTTHTTSAAGVLTFTSSATSVNRNYALFDAGIPAGLYVATTGSDTTGTGSIGNPFKTIRKAINASSTSDTIYVRGGTYTPSTLITVNRSGTTAIYYTITGYTGETVIINGTSVSTASYYNAIFEFDSRSYVRITNMNLTYSAVGGLAIDDNCHDLRFDNLTIYNCASFALKIQSGTTSSHDIIFENNVVNRNMNNWSGKTGQETMSFSKAYDSVIRNNFFKNNYYHVIDLKYGCHDIDVYGNTFNNTGLGWTERGGINYMGGYCFYMDSRTYVEANVSFYNNLCYGNQTFIVLNNEVTSGHYENITIYNNILNMSGNGAVLSGTGRYGIVLQEQAESPEVNKDINIYMNTINLRANVIGQAVYVRSTLTKNEIERLNISNNIITANNKTGASFLYHLLQFYNLNYTDGKVTLNNNLYYNFFPGATATMHITWYGVEYHSSTPAMWGNSPQFVDPQYVNPNPVCNFHLNATSPCIGAATSSLVSTRDYDGVIRPQGGTYDLGALEYVAGGGVSYAPLATAPSPITNAVDVVLPIASLNITISDQNGDNMDLYFRSNYTGAWATLGTNITLVNGTYRKMLPGFPGPSPHKYWWSINCTDGALWCNKTYNFTLLVVAPPTSGITVSKAHANWTTSTSVNITWTKGANTTNTYVYRSITGYTLGEILLYAGTNSYYNNTILDPSIRYYYRLRAYNSVSLLFGTSLNITLAETDNCISYGVSWLEFPGYLATDHNTQARYNYADSSTFTTASINETVLESSYTIYPAIASSEVRGLYSKGQHFMTDIRISYIYKVTIKAYREGSPGMIYCYLYAVGADLLPTGPILALGATNANLFTSAYPGDWYNISMSYYIMSASTNYAFVISNPSGTVSNRISIIIEDPGTYSDGQAFYSNDGGSTYGNAITTDTNFKIWGHEPRSYASLNTANVTQSISGTTTIIQSSLNAGQIYYYRMMANDTNNNTTRGNIRYTLTRPEPPTFMSIDAEYTNSSVNISWISGTGANRTVIVKGATGYPTTPSDGTVMYNGTEPHAWLTGITFNTSYYLSLFSFTVWGSLSRFSSGATLPWGGISFNCYNQSSGLPIGYNVLISSKAGDHVYYGPNLLGFTFVNISEMPLGDEIGFYVSNSSGKYNSQIYYYDLTSSIFYNLSFYLPVSLTPPTHNDSYPYLITVIDEASLTLDNVYVLVKTYVIVPDAFVNISSGYTDGNGQFSVNLIPNTLYKITLSKNGYITSVNDYIPSTSIFTTTIKLYFNSSSTTTEYLWPEQHAFDGYLDNSTSILHVNYTDALSSTTSWIMYIWRINTDSSDTLIATYTGTNQSFQIPLSVNNSYDYHVLIWVNSSIFGRVYDEFTTYGYHWHPTGKSAKLNLLMSLNFGWNPFGWANTIGMFFIIAALFSFGRRETYMSALLIGVLLLFLDLYIGFPTVWNALAGGAFPIIIIFIGILMLIRDRGMFGAS